NFPEPFEIGAVAGVINASALMFEDKAAISAMIIAQHAGAPMFARSQSYFPIAMRKTFPPFQLDDASETEVVRQVGHAPRHYTNLRMRQPSQCRLVKM